MTMGQRIRQARTEAGLSQRELAGQEFTRNMLSALEHDAANPSVHTLRYLAERLGKPISYFLEDGEQQDEGFDAISIYTAQPAQSCIRRLEEEDPAGRTAQWTLVYGQCLLDLAQEAIDAGRLPYARALLKRGEEAVFSNDFIRQLLSRRFYILCAACPETEGQLPELVDRIPREDEVLLLRAKAASTRGDWKRAEAYLSAAEDHSTAQWNFEMGEQCFHGGRYEQAAAYYHKAEEEMPKTCQKRLEICYREMGDYKMAYYYATK